MTFRALIHRTALVVLIGWGLSSLAAAQGTVTPKAAAKGRKIELSLYSLESERLLYRGNRTIVEDQDKVEVTTVFTTPAGKPFQTTVSVFEKVGLVPISYQLNDLRSGETESLIRNGDTIELRYRENSEEDEDDGTVDWEPGSLFTGTVVDFMHAQWAALMENREFGFSFLVPSKQDAYSFRILRDEERSFKAKGQEVIRMEPDSWIIRRLVDPMFFFFSTEEPRRLMEFRGRSSIKDETGEPQDLRITYSYLGQN